MTVLRWYFATEAGMKIPRKTSIFAVGRRAFCSLSPPEVRFRQNVWALGIAFARARLRVGIVLGRLQILSG
jgi:hypothetical protein